MPLAPTLFRRQKQGGRLSYGYPSRNGQTTFRRTLDRGQGTDTIQDPAGTRTVQATPRVGRLERTDAGGVSNAMQAAMQRDTGPEFRVNQGVDLGNSQYAFGLVNPGPTVRRPTSADGPLGDLPAFQRRQAMREGARAIGQDFQQGIRDQTNRLEGRFRQPFRQERLFPELRGLHAEQRANEQARNLAETQFVRGPVGVARQGRLGTEATAGATRDAAEFGMRGEIGAAAQRRRGTERTAEAAEQAALYGREGQIGVAEQGRLGTEALARAQEQSALYGKEGAVGSARQNRLGVERQAEAAEQAALYDKEGAVASAQAGQGLVEQTLTDYDEFGNPVSERTGMVPAGQVTQPPSTFQQAQLDAIDTELTALAKGNDEIGPDFAIRSRFNSRRARIAKQVGVKEADVKGRTISEAQAEKILQAANGDPARTRAIIQALGYSLGNNG